MKTKLITTGLLAGIISVPSVQALTVTETIDYSDSLSSSTLFSTSLGLLSEGTNTISGSLMTTCVATNSVFADCSAGDDVDFFDWTIADGFELDSASVIISNLTTTGTLNTNSLFVATFPGVAEFSDNGSFILNIANAPLNLNQARFVAASSSLSSPEVLQGIGDIGYDYSLTVNVVASAVPIPAAAWLFGSALFGLSAVKRKAVAA